MIQIKPTTTTPASTRIGTAYDDGVCYEVRRWRDPIQGHHYTVTEIRDRIGEGYTTHATEAEAIERADSRTGYRGFVRHAAPPAGSGVDVGP